jgi:hypothetical protein
MGEDYSERWATIDRNGGRHHLGIDGRLAPEAAPRARLPGNNRAAARNLKYMRAFAEAWPDLEFVQQVVALLPWGHSMTAIRQVVRLKLTLDGIEPKVERWLVVPLKIRLDRLHQTLQAAMGWTDSHLWEIRAGDTGWSIPDPTAAFADQPQDARKATLRTIIADTGVKRLTYLYDFGDG